MDEKISEVKAKLFEQIPILIHMGVEIEEYSQKAVVVSSKLQEHYNYEGTAFGGSLNTVALLSCFLTARKILADNGVVAKSLVIQSSEVKYLKPVTGNFMARCEYPDPKSFLHQLNRRGRARIELASSINLMNSEEALVEFKGRFVASI